jgi:hypothetical protein
MIEESLHPDHRRIIPAAVARDKSHLNLRRPLFLSAGKALSKLFPLGDDHND